MSYAHRLEGERRIELDDFDPADARRAQRMFVQRPLVYGSCEQKNGSAL